MTRAPVPRVADAPAPEPIPVIPPPASITVEDARKPVVYEADGRVYVRRQIGFRP